jgi:hypothetical protein
MEKSANSILKTTIENLKDSIENNSLSETKINIFYWV